MSTPFQIVCHRTDGICVDGVCAMPTSHHISTGNVIVPVVVEHHGRSVSNLRDCFAKVERSVAAFGPRHADPENA